MIPLPAIAAGKAVWKFLVGIPWQVWVLLALAAGIWWHGQSMYDRGYTEAETAWKAKVEQAERVAREKALMAERQHEDELDDIQSKLILERAKGYEERERTIADLRAGNLRLRHQWQGCRAGLPQAGGSAAGSDADAELRAAGAADLIGLGREADAQLRACQAVIQADRKAVNQ